MSQLRETLCLGRLRGHLTDLAKSLFIFFCFVITIQILSACSSPIDPPYHGTVETQPENRGIEFAANASKLLWSRSTNEIIFNSGGLIAKNPSTGKERFIADAFPYLEDWTLSDDGNYVYYFGNNKNGSSSLYKISLINPTRDTLAHSLILRSVNILDGRGLCSSADNVWVAYSTSHSISDPDSVFLFNNQKRTRLFLTVGKPLVFSPDGARLLVWKPNPYGGYGEFTYVIITLADYSSQTVTAKSPSPNQDFVSQFPLFRWDAAGLREFYSDGNACYIHNIITGSIDSVTSFLGGMTYAGWSHDGNLVAGWQKHYCWSSLPDYPCTADAYTLNLINLNLRTRTQVAFIRIPYRTPGVETSVAFSPDAKKVAYIASFKIYLQDAN